VKEGEGGKDREGYAVCLRCGKLVPAAGSFCTACGADLKAPPSPGREGSTDVESFRNSRQPGNAPPVPYPPLYQPSPPNYRESVPAQQQPYAGCQGPRQYQPPSPGYGEPQAAVTQQPYAGHPEPQQLQPLTRARRKTDEIALASLLCGVASFILLPLIPAVAAIILGYMSRDRIRRSRGSLEGEGLAVAGIVMGIVNIVLVLGFLTVLVVVSLYGT
jgi:hypothetical protein